jgi:anti-repressor protein
MTDTNVVPTFAIGETKISHIVPFDFEGAAVRTITQAGEPWFILADICRVLEIGNSSQAASRLDDDERGITTSDTPSGVQQMIVINESGLYSLILTSRKEAAKRFRKWVTTEVLPAIRKTGGYMLVGPDETPEALALRAMTMLQATVERQKMQLSVSLPKAEALDRIATADGSLNVTEAAKALQVRPKVLFDYLKAHGWIYKRPGSSTWLGYQTHTSGGDLEHKVTTVLRGDGSEKIAEQVRVTPKGLSKLAKLIAGRPQLVSPNQEEAA